MKKRDTSLAFGLGSILVLVFGVTSPRVYAGPSSSFWTRSADSKTEQAAPALALSSAPICVDWKIVPVKETRTTSANGRGSQQVVERSSKRSCSSCGSFTVMKPSLPNGRGPLQPVTLAGLHDCTTACAAMVPTSS